MSSPHDGFVRRQLEVSMYNVDGCRVLALDGECDIATRDELRRGLDEALAERRTALIVDLSCLSFCDGGSAALVLVAARANTLLLVGPNGIPLRVFDLLDPAGKIPRYATVDDAANDLPAHHGATRQA